MGCVKLMHVFITYFYYVVLKIKLSLKKDLGVHFSFLI